MADGDRGGGSRYLYAPFREQDAALARLETRLEAVEAIVGRLETDREVNKEKQNGLEARFNQIDSRLDRIDGLISRLAWLIIAAILGGFMSFIMSGSVMGV